MMSSVDLYLGAFLILCGFALSLVNLRRLIKDVNPSLSSVLISENIVLMCIGIAFISRSVHEMKPLNTEMQDIEERIADMEIKDVAMDCNFLSVMRSYGPLIVSLVNSFLSLIIDNYMHYKLVADVKKEEDENTVQGLNHGLQSTGRSTVSKLLTFWKKNFSVLVIALQWIVPIVIALFMYPMEVKETQILMNKVRSHSDFCVAMFDVRNSTCFTTSLDGNYSLELRKLIPLNYIEAHENLIQNDSIAKEIDSVINNVFKIIMKVKNETSDNVNVTSAPLWRKGKTEQNCMKICYLDNKSILLYMFIVAIASYFVPITISMVILTKIHVMGVKRHSVKTYVSRELLYNILFWTPVMFDTFVSLLLCSYSMNGMRTSIFNVIANIYQAVKNFMNTKYFQENSVRPI